MIQNVLFQQDNARPHTAYVTQAFKHRNNINLLPHSATSLELKPIKQFLEPLQKRPNAFVPRPHTEAEVRAAITRVWPPVPQKQINNLVSFMYRKRSPVIDACVGSIAIDFQSAFD